jgi:hypothetical protein
MYRHPSRDRGNLGVRMNPIKHRTELASARPLLDPLSRATPWVAKRTRQSVGRALTSAVLVAELTDGAPGRAPCLVFGCVEWLEHTGQPAAVARG